MKEFKKSINYASKENLGYPLQWNQLVEIKLKRLSLLLFFNEHCLAETTYY